jgi:hypothetical protein
VRRFGPPYPTEPFSKAKKGRKAKAEKPQRQLTAEEEDFLAPVGFEPEAVAPTFQAPQASPELQHPELERPAKAKKAAKPPPPKTPYPAPPPSPPASNSSASNANYFKEQAAAKKALEAQKASQAEHSDERTAAFDADVKKFSKNRTFVVVTCWLENEKGSELTAKEIEDAERLLDEGYQEIFASGAFTGRYANWGEAFPFLKEGGRKSEAVEAREDFLRTLYLQNPKFGKVITMNPFHVLTKYDEKMKKWVIYVGRDGNAYDKKTRQDYSFPEWAGPFTSWDDFENGEGNKWVTEKFWTENIAPPWIKKRRPA